MRTIAKCWGFRGLLGALSGVVRPGAVMGSLTLGVATVHIRVVLSSVGCRLGSLRGVWKNKGRPGGRRVVGGARPASGKYALVFTGADGGPVMRRIRLLLLGMFAVLAVGAVASSSASAAACKAEPSSGNFALCITTLGGSEELVLIERTVGILDFKETKTPSELEVESLGAHVVCFNAASTGVLEPTASSVKVRSLTITFTNGCHLVGAEAVCKVTEPITTVPIEASITLLTKMPDILFKPESGTFFSTVHVTGT